MLKGHNGSGKSSLINILIGNLSVTSGKVNFFGLDLETEIDTIRPLLGVCHQHDILFDKLSAKEHLLFYGRLKGVPESELENQCLTLIKEVGLEEKTDSMSETLSGGQKRKLSLAISFIGNPLVLFLE